MSGKDNKKMIPAFGLYLKKRPENHEGKFSGHYEDCDTKLELLLIYVVVQKRIITS